MIRFRIYMFIRNFIAGIFSGDDETAAESERHEYTEIVYDESEIKLAEYEMKYSPLLRTVSEIAGEMELKLRPIQGENAQAMDEYKKEAEKLGRSIEEKVFSRREWLL